MTLCSDDDTIEEFGGITDVRDMEAVPSESTEISEDISLKVFLDMSLLVCVCSEGNVD